MGGFDAMGPAIVLNPTRGMPTNIDCGLVFSPDVVDKQENQVCAPADGNIENECTPGDTSQFTFKTEPLTIESASFENNATGVNRMDPMLFAANAVLDPSSAAGITVTEAGANFTQFTAAVGTGTMTKTIMITWTVTLQPTTTYVVTIPVSAKDTFLQPIPAPVVVTFTTGA
jgi:hypothetical protein